ATLVDLYRGAFDAIHAFRVGRDVRSADINTPFLGQRDARLSAAQDDLPCRTDGEALAVGVDFYLSWTVGQWPRAVRSEPAHHDRAVRIAALEHQHHVAPDVLAAQIDATSG